MSDDTDMRFRLQQVASYRQICAVVRAGASHTLVNAAIWLGLTFMLYEIAGPAPVVLAQFALGLAELGVGLWKKVRPSVGAILADGIVLIGFGGFVLGRQAVAALGVVNWPVNPVSVFLGAWWLFDAVKTLRAYAALNRAFPDRPTPDQVAWFDDLTREIRAADPGGDDQALALPTRPPWKVKLLGGTAFFVGPGGVNLLVAGPDDFQLVRQADEPGTDRPRVALRLFDEFHPPFHIDGSSWQNYQKWLAANAASGPRV